MSKILYVSDLDGTLLDSNKCITKETSVLLNKSIEIGCHFSVATARTPASVEVLLANLNIKEPIIVMNGAAIYDLNSNEYIDVEYIGQERAYAILESLEGKLNQTFIYTIKDNDLEVYYQEPLNKVQQAFYEERKELSYKRFTKEPCTDLKKIAYFVFMDKQEEIEEIYRRLKEISGLALTMYKDIYDEDAYLLEVYSERATKANGLLKMKEKYAYSKIVCFGDNLNDLSMFKISDEAYAVANAVDEVKLQATGIIEGNNQNGVARFIQKHLES